MKADMRNFWHKVNLGLLSLEYAFVMFVLCFCIFGATHQQATPTVSVKYTAPTTSCNVELVNFFTYDKDEWGFSLNNPFDTNFKSWTKSYKKVAIDFYGVNDWEMVWMPIQVEANREYTITFDYVIPTITVDWTSSGGFSGKGLKAIISTSTDRGMLKNYAINSTAGSGYYNCPSNTTGTAKLTFTSTTTRTLYFVLNFGYVDDGATKHFEFSNFELFKKIKFGDTYGTLPNKYSYPTTGWEFSNGTKITFSTRCSDTNDHAIYRSVFGYTKKAWLFYNTLSDSDDSSYISNVRTSSNSFTFTHTGVNGWEYMYVPIYTTKTGIAITFDYTMPLIPKMDESYNYGEKVDVQILSRTPYGHSRQDNDNYQKAVYSMKSLASGTAKLTFSTTRGETYYFVINLGSVQDFVSKDFSFSNFSIVYGI